MALHPLRLRRALARSLSILHTSRQGPKPISFALLSAPRPTPIPTFSSLRTTTRFFTSTTSLFRKAFDSEADEIRPDTILFEGCDYNHWLITIDFPKDANLTRDQMIDTYVNTAAQVFGSVEEAKKKIYALSTTTYQGFQVECSEETSEKFKNSYIDPVNKEYGGDKYVNGEIFPRPPPVHYGRRSNRDNRPREQNYGPPPQQNYGQGPPPQQNYGQGPPPQQNYGQMPPSQQNYGQRPPPQQSYGQGPPQQTYGLGPRPQQNYGPPPQQNYGPPPQQNFERPLRQNYVPPPPPPQQGYAPRPNQSYGQSPPPSPPPPPQSFGQNTQQSYGNSSNFPPQQNFSPAGSGERNPMPSYQGNFNQPEPRNHYAQGQGNLQSPVPPEQRGSLQDGDFRSSQGGTFERVSGGQGDFSSFRNN